MVDFRRKLAQDGISTTKKGIIATTPRAAKRSTCTKKRPLRTAEGKLPSENSALPGRAPELAAPRRDRQPPAGELVNFFADFPLNVLRQGGGGVIEAAHHLVGRRGPVVEETATLVPDEGAVARIQPVTQLEQRHLAGRLPDEEVEKVVVKPAPARSSVVRDPVNFFEHLGSLTLEGVSGFVHLVGKSPHPVADLVTASTLRRPARSGKEGHAIQARRGMTKGNCLKSRLYIGSNLALTKE